jgi:hypothetical protein
LSLHATLTPGFTENGELEGEIDHSTHTHWEFSTSCHQKQIPEKQRETLENVAAEVREQLLLSPEKASH